VAYFLNLTIKGDDEMSRRNIIIELSHTKRLEDNAFAAMSAPQTGADPQILPKFTSLEYDINYPPVSLPKLTQSDFPEGELYDTRAAFSFDVTPESSTYLVRGSVEEEELAAFEEEARKNKAVNNIYADVGIEPMIICPGSAPLGTDADVERLLCVPKMQGRNMDGLGVLVAIVDTGINTAYLNSHGKHPTIDLTRSWSWNPGVVIPGSVPVDHGTMCAYDVCIAAPKCTILDIALLHALSTPPGGTIMSGMLSDAIRAYSHLLTIMTAPRRPGENRSLVVSNSWGMFNPSWDFPVGHPGNYSDNPAHPFNVIVASLERAGADIVFAAGNCGADCPDGRCMGVTTRAIYGANSSPSVTCVAGVDTTRARVGYSAIGPGRLSNRKPDICGYTHFKGSGVYAADGGTSAACPVISGVIAAIRSRRPYSPTDSTTSPAAIRNLLTSTAIDLGPTGYDYAYGYGVVDGCAIADKVAPVIINICDRYPWFCKLGDLCRRYPWLCKQGFPVIRLPNQPVAEATTQVDELMTTVMEQMQASNITPEEAMYIMGYLQGSTAAPQKTANKEDCGCKDKQ
jgi:hypothetical protein